MDEKKMKVLVVDDEKIIRDFFSRLLTLQGLEVVGAEDGYKAVELARQGEFDLFFIDIRMPGLNGLETYRSIRRINPQAKAVMMTGYSTDDISDELQREDLAGFIRKPFDISEIKGLVDSVVVEKKKRPLNILVIDDDPVILNFFANLLKNKNQRYKIASDKDQALTAARQEKFDLVFLDLVLKEVDGIQTYKEIKQVLPGATIIVITGFPQKAEELKGAVEIAGCLYKPFEVESVLEYIEKIRAK